MPARLLRWQLYPLVGGITLFCASSGSYRALPATLCAISGVLAALLVPVPRVRATKVKSCEDGKVEKVVVGVIDFETASKEAIGRIFYPARPHTGSDRPGYLFRDDAHGLTTRFMSVAAPSPLNKYLPTWMLGHWRCISMDARYAALPPHRQRCTRRHLFARINGIARNIIFPCNDNGKTWIYCCFDGAY